MNDVTNLNMASCLGPDIPSKPIQKCNQFLLQDIGTHVNYKGPFKNVSKLIIPTSYVKATPSYSLMALNEQDIPKEWSWYNIGGNKIEDGSRNQASCGCCWAMAFVSALGDRYAIKYNIAAPKPSAVPLISCGGPEIGKNGINGSASSSRQCYCGNSCYAGSLWLEQGGSIGLEECFPYSLVSSKPYYPQYCDQDCQNIAPDCSTLNDSNCCDYYSSKVKFTVAKGSTKYIVVTDENNVVNQDATIKAIQTDIMGKGPTPATFWVPDDFQDWWINGGAGSNNIYIPKVAPKIGENGHTVVLTGWGEENGIKYWEMRNTWGSPGYCRFAMSISTPKELWTCIDIPKFEGYWLGGCITMDPGPLSQYDWITGKGGMPVGGGWIEDKKINWKLLQIVLVGIIFIIILLIIIIKI